MRDACYPAATSSPALMCWAEDEGLLPWSPPNPEADLWEEEPGRRVPLQGAPMQRITPRGAESSISAVCLICPLRVHKVGA